VVVVVVVGGGGGCYSSGLLHTSAVGGGLVSRSRHVLAVGGLLHSQGRVGSSGVVVDQSGLERRGRVSIRRVGGRRTIGRGLSVVVVMVVVVGGVALVLLVLRLLLLVLSAGLAIEVLQREGGHDGRASRVRGLLLGRLLRLRLRLRLRWWSGRGPIDSGRGYHGWGRIGAIRSRRGNSSMVIVDVLLLLDGLTTLLGRHDGLGERE
jgi:hypothetical protein